MLWILSQPSVGQEQLKFAWRRIVGQLDQRCLACKPRARHHPSCNWQSGSSRSLLDRLRQDCPRTANSCGRSQSDASLARPGCCRLITHQTPHTDSKQSTDCECKSRPCRSGSWAGTIAHQATCRSLPEAAPHVPDAQQDESTHRHPVSPVRSRTASRCKPVHHEHSPDPDPSPCASSGDSEPSRQPRRSCRRIPGKFRRSCYKRRLVNLLHREIALAIFLKPNQPFFGTVTC